MDVPSYLASLVESLTQLRLKSKFLSYIISNSHLLPLPAGVSSETWWHQRPALAIFSICSGHVRSAASFKLLTRWTSLTSRVFFL